ncbi:GtrA family protein [Sandaracinobacteroides hominis]|uniref:GtrA family protein n=1 Tax=Sandaracinobacteroides hominis TaxID=2780086 RepID=UPI0018F695ED|nr:GtrA family protein [Sandaracinobacteroides hominis]
MPNRPQWIGQSLRFGMVAPLVFLVDWGVLTGLSRLGIPPLWGRVFSLSASVGAGFLLNRFFTFRAEGRPTLPELGRYLLAAGLGMAVNYGVFALLHRAGLADAVAIAGGMLAAALVTFTRFRAIFRK